MAALEVLLQNFLTNIDLAALIFSSFEVCMYNVHNRYVLRACINLEVLRYGTSMTYNWETSWYISIYCFISGACTCSWLSPIFFKRYLFPQYILTPQATSPTLCLWRVHQFSSQNKMLAEIISQLAFFLLDGHPTSFDRPHLKSSKMFTFWLGALILLLSPVIATNPLLLLEGIFHKKIKFLSLHRVILQSRI